MKHILFIPLFLGFLFAGVKPGKNTQAVPARKIIPSRTEKIGDYPFPTNPMNDRALGYLLQGKIKNAIGNYGGFVDWNNHPAGLWGEYTYLPNVAFLAGVPGHQYSSAFEWNLYNTVIENGETVRQIWESSDAYNTWFENGDTNFVGFLFEAEDGRGLYQPDSIAKINSIDEITTYYQWGIDNVENRIYISTKGEINPNNSWAKIGLIYPWALRPSLKERTDDFDIYNYGDDQEEWTEDDQYQYYGANVAESWFTRFDPSTNTDWQASTKARVNTHNTEVDAGTIFGETVFVDKDDTYPLLAHSAYSQTWPTRYNIETGEMEPFWPGWWAEEYYGDSPEEWADEEITDCSGTRKDADCWKEVPGRFISDMDVYMEFDDRWAHRGNLVNTNNEYLQSGYPMGLKIRAEAHSYGVSYAEDIMFVTVKVRNESGDFYDEDGNFHEGMIMPDGTKLNRGKGFNYQGVTLGFYMDADALIGDINGYNPGIHTNDDDYMEFYDERFEISGESLIISMAMIYDYDGNSGGVTDLGVVATQLLDTPKATREIDLDLDGFPDRFPGEDLKMTDWHWFDWYNRPGVVSRESNTNCCAGAPGRPQARNKEEIMYKLMVGDTTNISSNENAWFFHTPNPDTDLGSELNPHFDSLEGLEKEDAFDEGLDCVFIMSCGPFDLKVGEEVPFSFSVIFGQLKYNAPGDVDFSDLVNNAKFAQIMYNSHYQGYTPPAKPNVHAVADHEKVTLYWNNSAEFSNDIVTGYADFEGYKIYKSIDGGSTWGTPDKKLYDQNDIFVGWQPLAQFDLDAVNDSIRCIYENDECGDGYNRGRSIFGPDPHAPWNSLGSNTGFDAIDTNVTINGKDYQYYFVDRDVKDGLKYTYAVTAYDMGVDPDFTITWQPDGSGGFIADTVWSYANPEHWSSPDGYASIENSKGTTVLDKNYVQVYPGYKAQATIGKIGVVPNPYKVRSMINETEWIRNIRFTKLPPKCTIKIYTVNGEHVQTIYHEDLTSQDSNTITSGGEATWDMRTVNNQEVAPGLYVFVVQANGMEDYIGKFAVVR